MKKLMPLVLCSLMSLPFSGFANDILVHNNTSFYGTGRLNSSPCSDAAGDTGIMQPYSSLPIPESAIKMFCLVGSCTAHIYLTKDCSGPEVASAKLSAKNGVLSVTNYDPADFSVVGSGFEITVNPVNQSAFKNWIQSIFK